jgi:hypothetical protein
LSSGVTNPIGRFGGLGGVMSSHSASKVLLELTARETSEVNMLFCAHAVFYFKLVEAKQESFLVHENVYLIVADDPAEARARAEVVARANEDASEDTHLELNEQKASYVYGGLRKIIEAEQQPRHAVLGEVDGLEVTYSVFEVDTLEDVLALVRGEMVDLLYRE